MPGSSLTAFECRTTCGNTVLAHFFLCQKKVHSFTASFYCVINIAEDATHRT
jgi:hypothetical protein